MKITVIALGVFFPVLINTVQGVRGTDPVLRARWSRGGYLLGTASLTCTALGTLTGTNQELGFGALQLAAPAFNGGGWVQWGFWATGVQCEGASAAQLVSQGLGFEE